MGLPFSLPEGPIRATQLWAGLALVLAHSGCADDGKRPLGATCDSPSQCRSGVCSGGVCLDPYGDTGPGELSSLCGADPLVGTCAAPLGAMAYGCFRPAGDCVAFEDDAGTFIITWGNGAHNELVSDAEGDTTSIFGPDGQRCGVITQTGEQEALDERTFTPTDGDDYTFRNEGLRVTLGCPDGDMVNLADGFGLARCAGLTFGCEVLTGASCTEPADCGATEVCCPFGGGAATATLCVTGDRCPP